MSPSPALAAIAFRVDAMVLNPANMTRARELAEECLAEPEQADVNALFPDHPDDPFPDRDPNVVQTLGQRALALAAIHDVYCAGVEKVVVVPGDLTFEAVLADNQLIPAWLRAFRWAVILDQARGLGAWALPWYELQMRRFERDLPEKVDAAPTTAPAAGEVGAVFASSTPPVTPARVSGGVEEQPKAPAQPDPCIHALLLLAEAQRKGEKPTVKQLAQALGIKRQALYENKLFAPVREMANKLFGLFEKEAKKGDWPGPKGSKGRDGT